MKQHKRLHLFLAVLVAVMFVATMSWAHEAAWPGKRLSEVFPKAKNLKPRQVTLTPDQIGRIEKAAGAKIGVEEKSPTFYIASGVDENSESDKVGTIGAVVFIDAVGERGNIEVNVAISPNGKLHAVSLWKNKEGKALESKEFLGQFNDKKKPTDPFKVGEDIVAPKGAEKSSQAIAIAAKKGWLMFQEVFGVKQADEGSEAHSDDHDKEGEPHDH